MPNTIYEATTNIDKYTFNDPIKRLHIINILACKLERLMINRDKNNDDEIKIIIKKIKSMSN